jgi:8-oxo-dGTP pyrophosphatase MutT (NUDIX family)
MPSDDAPLTPPLCDPRRCARAFAETARRRLRAPATAESGTGPSDHDLDGRRADLAGLVFTPAAVLVPVLARPEPTVLLTRRADTLTRHAGQIAFPGGRVDPSDADPAATALREAAEEVGLRPGHVVPLGLLDTYRTGTGYAITPLVALIDPAFEPVPQAAEVAETFEVPLAFLMDPGNHQTHTREWNGQSRRYHAMPWGTRYIWGATAGILKNMHERLFLP